MKRRQLPPTTDGLLLALAHELLDAHLDTIELRLAGEGEFRWRAHLDYLQALRRTAEEMFVLATSTEDGVFAAPASPAADGS